MLPPIQNEKELLQKIAAGDESAFTTLADAYWNRVFSVALTYIKLPELAEDVVQEIFLKLWKKKEKLEEIESLENYLFIATRNEVFSALRKKGPQYPVGTYLENTLEEKSAVPDQALGLKQLQELLHKAVALLPERQREAWKLSREEDCSYEEIAGRMRLSKNTVKIHLVKAMNFLRVYIRDHTELLSLLLLYLLQKF